ncbi:MAG: hypothetical protein D6730_15280, partial [Bacteroidetes bacterium]
MPTNAELKPAHLAWQQYVQRFDALYTPAFAELYEGEAYEGHRIFACHAAFPVYVTVDLLYQLWMNFRVYPARSSGRMLNIPNFVVSDFLLSGICREVSPRLYAIDFGLREQLLQQLREDARFGQSRIKQLASFLEQYHKEAQTGPLEQSMTTYHHWIADSVQRPTRLVEELSQRLGQAIDGQQLLELRKLNRILADLQLTHEAFKPLAAYSQLMDNYLILQKARPGAGLKLKTVDMGPIRLPFFGKLAGEVPEEKTTFEQRAAFVPGKNKLYALLVGIDEYRSPEVPPLRGAVNDLKALLAFLQARSYPNSLHPKLLINEEATRENLIQAFFTHLSKAGPGDAVLFYFSGHGSQEPAHPIFHHMEPDGQFETLLCYDSRAGSPDLLDVELNALLYLIDQKKPNITSIINSCYAGEDERFQQKVGSQRSYMPPREVEPLDPAAEAYREAAQPFVFFRREFAGVPLFREQLALALQESAPSLDLPQPAQIQIASTLSHEQDYEGKYDGEIRSYFCAGLLGILGKSRYVYSYEELMRKLNNYLVQRGIQQTPHARISGERSLEEPFLHASLAPFGLDFPVYWRSDNRSWVIDAGLAHGIPRIRSKERTILAVYPEEADTRLAAPLAEATIEAVFYGQSVLGNVGEADELGRLDKQQLYKAVIRNLPIEKTRVYVQPALARKSKAAAPTPDPESLKDSLLRHELAVYYELVAGAEEAEYLLKFIGTTIQLVRSRDQSVVLEGTDAWSLPNQLAAISRWDRIWDLRNPLSFLPPGRIQLELSMEEEDGTTLVLKAGRDGSISIPHRGGHIPPLELKLTHREEAVQAASQPATDPEVLYVAMLLLWPDYQIRASEALAIEKGNTQQGSMEYTLALPEGKEEEVFGLKLIISQTPFNAHRLEQDGLEGFIPPINAKATNSLEALFERAVSRKALIDTEAELVDWTTDELRLVVRRQAEEPAPQSQQQAERESGAMPPESETEAMPLYLRLIRQEQQALTGRLDLGNCSLTHWPEELFELHHLQELVMSNAVWNRESKSWIRNEHQQGPNYLHELPRELEKLSALKKLYLGGQQAEGRYWEIQDVSVLATLPQLEVLNLNYTRIKDLSPLSSLHQLLELDLSFTGVSDLTPLSRLQQLQVLNLYSCREVADISPLASLSKLQALYLSKTGVSELAPLAGLQQLEVLYLRKTPVREARPLGELQKLRKLDLSGTQVADLSPLLPLLRRGLPVLLRRDKDLPAIQVYDCPLEVPPREVVKAGNEAILAYFEEQAKEKGQTQTETEDARSQLIEQLGEALSLLEVLPNQQNWATDWEAVLEGLIKLIEQYLAEEKTDEQLQSRLKELEERLQSILWRIRNAEEGEADLFVRNTALLQET